LRKLGKQKRRIEILQDIIVGEETNTRNEYDSVIKSIETLNKISKSQIDFKEETFGNFFITFSHHKILIK